MAEALPTALTGEVLKKALSLAADEIVRAWGFEEDLTILSRTLDMIQAVLGDAEKRQESQMAVKLWMEMLKDVAAQADDVLDEVQYEMLRRKVQIRYQMARKVSSFFSSSNPLAFRLKMAHRIKDINTNLEKINKQAQDFKLQPEAADHPRQPQHQPRPQITDNRQTDSFLDEFEVIGRENDALQLVETLIGPTSSEENLAVTPVVGMGGLGKTTLAQLVYNDERVNKHFNIKVWVCVSDNFDVMSLLTQILGSITKSKVEVQSRDEIIQKLQKELEGKKYLLVLDDVWSRDEALWGDFRSCLLKIDKGCGSNIIITTRSTEVASITKTSTNMHIVHGLSNAQCLSIIQGRAFAPGGPPKTPELEHIANQIAEKCRGVPLVATVVGSMLRTKENIGEWLSIQRSGVWDLQGGDRVQKILKLSFDNLPKPLLKNCFALCSIFKKDAFMDKEQLIQLWMALGYLRGDESGRNKDLEEVGEEFFKILSQSSLFQDFKKDGYGNIKGCKMHDLVHDLALSLSKFGTFNSEASTSNDLIPKVRHLAFYSSGEKIFPVLKEKEKDSIGELIHLRYLDLSETSINFLPKSIGKLYNLQTLRVVECWYLKKFPKEVSNLISLRHFHFDKFSVDMPLKVGQLTCLRTLPCFEVGEEKGQRIEELGCLEFLRGRLTVRNLQKVSSKEEGERADLVGKGNLYGLKYVWSDEREGSNLKDEDVLDGLQAPPNLETLEIGGFMGDNFPEWVIKMAVSVNGEWLPFQYLVDIKFTKCTRCEHVPMLGHLSFLQKLVLEYMSNVKCIDSLFYGINYDTNTSSVSGASCSKRLFPALRSFKIKMEKLETWMDASATTGGVTSSVVVFPCLEELYIERCGINLLPHEAFRGARTSLKHLGIHKCPNLETIPTLQGFTSLEKLSITLCSGLTSLESGLLGSCTSLAKLMITFCPNLTSLPELHDQSHSLEELNIGGNRLPEGLNCLARLKKLSLGPFSEETIPEEFQHLTTLTFISLYEFGSVEALPDWFGNLSSLEGLELWFCSKLKSLPSMEAMGRLTKLKTIGIYYCPLLEERVAEGSGPEWSKIALIPKCYIR